MKDIYIRRLTKNPSCPCVRDVGGPVATQRKRLGMSLECKRPGEFRVGGENLCRSHAMNKVFKLVLDANSQS